MKRKKDKKALKPYALGKDTKTQVTLGAMMLPGTAAIILFSIIPLFGLVLAFKNYTVRDGILGIFSSDWYGFQNFKIIFSNHDFFNMLKNTLGINLFGNLINIPVTLIFALILNEVYHAKFKSLIQTITYMPHFISWVVYGGIVITLLSSDGGAINIALTQLGIIKEPISFMSKPKYFWGVAITSGLLKELGWGAILYIAAIAGVEKDLYEAASIDGANRFQCMWHITIPGILSTVMIMIIFAVAGILNNNFTQIYVLQNSLNLSRSEVIDTYIYKVGIKQLQFGMAAAVNVTKSFFAIALLLLANKASGKLTGRGLF